MIKEGAIENVEVIFSMHLATQFPTGVCDLGKNLVELSRDSKAYFFSPHWSSVGLSLRYGEVTWN
ncbi:hypothetical protein Scep_023229 [Stephania cephalantha]|uniref:Uncharacterized protein n=1 Tax=Stephania cephalantha TaxID=152367 RepID=A0AAP0EUS7_9MAGN